MSQVSGYCELLAPVIDVAQAAALEILRIYEGGFSVNRKADRRRSPRPMWPPAS